jgi:Na+-translocating ferredoxin:NAD+ oxidoreductase RNF subunit RnfB
VREALPGANCGGCGFPGCDGCADAIASGAAPAGACPVCSAEAKAKIAEIMGVEVPDASNRKVARVICQGDCETANIKFDYQGIADCTAAMTVNDGYKSCKFACMGPGTCVKACKFDAISIDPVRKIAVVDEEKCTGCGACAAACPKDVITLNSIKNQVMVLCRNTGKGKPVMADCKKGCIALNMHADSLFSYFHSLFASKTNLLEVKDEVGHVGNNTRDSSKFMINTIDLNRTDSITFERTDEHATNSVTNCDTITRLERTELKNSVFVARIQHDHLVRFNKI